MIGTAVLCLMFGLPSLAIGVHLRRSGAHEKRKVHKKGVKRPPSPTSFLVGGALLTLAGVALLAAHFGR
jgi:hypothetical protein